MSWGGRGKIIKKKKGKRESPSNIPVFEYQTSFFPFFNHRGKKKLNSPFLAAMHSILDFFNEFAKACYLFELIVLLRKVC